MSSRFSGSERVSICICARLSIWKTPVVSAVRIALNVSGSSIGIRERSTNSLRVRAISSTARSTAESIPRPSRSILRKPASAHESLSHCAICLPSIAAGTTGQMSVSGCVERTIPPGCWEAWRGWPWAARASSASSRQRCVSARFAPIASAMFSATASRLSKTSTIRATRSTSPRGSPRTLPKSRTALRER